MTSLGKYEIQDKVGRGGFATVYRARDPDLDRVVALKVLTPHLFWDSTSAERFRREAQAMARLDHPNIVVIYEVGQDDERLYIAMAYLAGRTLARVLAEEGTMSLERALPILEQVASALDYAHGEGVLHRDVKPSNIMVRESPRGELRVTLMDFGLVKAMESSESLTSMGTILGSPEYMAPEQADPDRVEEISPATDCYALGVVAYEMLVGRVPFPGNVTPTLVAHMQKPPPDPQTIRHDLPDHTAQVLLKALSKRGEERYATAGDLVQALRLGAEAEEQARLQEERLAGLYTQLQDAVAAQDWATAEAFCHEVLALEPDYRDVPELCREVHGARESATWQQGAEEALAPAGALESPRGKESEPKLSSGAPVLSRPVSARKEPRAGIPGWVWVAAATLVFVLAIMWIGSALSDRPTPEPEVIRETVVVTQEVEKPVEVVVTRVVVEEVEVVVTEVVEAEKEASVEAVPSATVPPYDGPRLFTYYDFEGESDGYLAEIYVRDLASGRETRLTDLGDANRGPVWSPDGQRIAFFHWEEAEDDHRIYLMDADGSNLEEVPGDYHASSLDGLSWSPDGRFLAFHDFRRHSVQLIMLYQGYMWEGADKSGEDIALSPDGSQIAFWTREGIDVNDYDGWVIYVAEAFGSGLGRLTDPEDGFGEIEPHWSTDGEWLVFSRWEVLENDESGPYQWWQMRPDGSHVQRVQFPIEIIDQSYFPWERTLTDDWPW